MSSYVVEGATLKCDYGDSTSKLKIPVKHEIFINGKCQGNMMDCVPMVNIMPFGMCSNLLNPTVAAATAANYGKLQKMPCIPAIVTTWLECKNDVLVDNFPAILKSSTLGCAYLGVISVEDDGQ